MITGHKGTKPGDMYGVVPVIHSSAKVTALYHKNNKCQQQNAVNLLVLAEIQFMIVGEMVSICRAINI